MNFLNTLHTFLLLPWREKTEMRGDWVENLFKKVKDLEEKLKD